jgi:hypothetical protein
LSTGGAAPAAEVAAAAAAPFGVDAMGRAREKIEKGFRVVSEGCYR